MNKYIDVEVLKNNMHKCTWVHDMKCVEKFVDMLPAADVVEVVRCCDCIYHTGYGECGNGRWDNWSNSDYKSSYPEALDMDYCSYGIRKNG